MSERTSSHSAALTSTASVRCIGAVVSPVTPAFSSRWKRSSRECACLSRRAVTETDEHGRLGTQPCSVIRRAIRARVAPSASSLTANDWARPEVRSAERPLLQCCPSSHRLQTAALGVKQSPALGGRPPLRRGGDQSQARRGAYASARLSTAPNEPCLSAKGRTSRSSRRPDGRGADDSLGDEAQLDGNGEPSRRGASGARAHAETGTGWRGAGANTTSATGAAAPRLLSPGGAASVPRRRFGDR